MLTASGPLGKKSRLIATYILEHDSPWLKVELDVDWHEDHQLFRLACPTRFAGAQARYGIPFGSILRSQTPGELKTEAQWEVPASRWAAALNDTQDSGLVLVTESKYGFSCRSGQLTLSLLRAPKDQDPQADMGRHIIRFALGKFAVVSTPAQENPALAADTLYAPIVLYRGKPIDAPFTLQDAGSLSASWVMPSFNGRGYVIRLSETMGLSGTARLQFNRPVKTVTMVDLLERPLGKLNVDSDACAVDYKAFDIISLRVE
jgi:alpha-mannosidase